MRNATPGTSLLLSVMSLVLCTVGVSRAQDGETVAEQHEEGADTGVVVGGGVAPVTPAAGVETERVPLLRGLRREDTLYASQACVHESSWRGGVGGTGDCGGQLQVFLARRHTGEGLRDVINRTMPRFAAGRTSRTWVRFLPWGPMREDPPGWPAAYGAQHDSERWHSVVARVSGFLHGEEPLPCAEQPEQWFGRLCDSEALAARLASGRWRETNCNPSGDPAHQTLNAYLTRVRSPGLALAAVE